MNVRYRVELSQAERCELTAMLSKGKRVARKRGGEARSLPRCVNGPSAPVCELGIFSLSVAEVPQWDVFRKSLDEVDNPAGALS
jgi:hypothetical protein